MNTGILTEFVAQEWSSSEAQRPALSLEDQETWSYGELHEQASRYANGLAGLGVSRGDRVGVVMFNSLEYWAAYLAITRLGAIAVRVNFRLAPDELRYVLQDANCTVVCFHDSLCTVMDAIRDDVGAGAYVCFPYEGDVRPAWALGAEVLVNASGGEPVIEVPPSLDDPAMLMYTSGTTGRPKGVVWTHGNTLWFGAMQAMEWGYGPTTVAMTTGPLYHVGAFEDLLVPALMSRGHAVITRSGGFSIVRAAATLAKLGVTDALLYPFMLYDLLQEPDLAGISFDRLRRVVTGGSPIMAWAVKQLRERFPDVELTQTYGLTEGGGITTSMPAGEGCERLESVGRPLPLTEVVVAGEDGEHLRLGEIGEVLVRSPGVSDRYWGKPEESAQTFVNGWCKTGDLGRLERGGYLTITGRKKDMIKSGGENIYPIEIESVLAEHADIQEAAVIGVPDRKYVEAVCAVVVPKRGAGLTADIVTEFCRERLASYKKPRYVVCVDVLPKTPSGKIQKYLLREQFGSIGGPEAALAGENFDAGGQESARPVPGAQA